MSSEIVSAIKQICDEKGLSYESVVETIESALAAAYRKDFGEKNQNIKVVFDSETGKSVVYDVKTVVEDLPEEIIEETVDSAKTEQIAEDSNRRLDEEAEERKFNPKTQIQLSEAKLLKKSAKIDDEIKTELEVHESYGRMAAQTAKQVIIQKLREAEREMIFSDFKNKEHEVIAGVVQRVEGRVVLVDLDRAVGVLPPEEQIYGERYNQGDRIKVYVKAVNLTARGSEIILSRTSEEILKKVFYLEIPEISNNLIEIKAVAREAGSRSKVAVLAIGENIDPIGSCVGQRGARIQVVIKELGGEKIDIIEYDEEPIKFIANALAPAKVLSIEIDEKEKRAIVTVADDQLSLAIGRNGQNVRLAARLTGWKLDLIGEKSGKVEIAATDPIIEVAEIKEEVIKDEEIKDVKVEEKIAEKKTKKAKK
ncbi:MAG: transcription termination factor NusA [bacterium]|nr:transcription termination factor NusA [bacterium]